jgi:homocitrate synthase NifV
MEMSSQQATNKWRQVMMRSDIILEDTTLRDGEQAPGLAFSKQTKLKILEQLLAVGVRWIEVGIPAMGGEELETLREISDRGYDAMLIAWNRGIKEDVAFSLDLGYRAVHIGLPTSNVHLERSLGRDRSWLLSTATDLVKYVKDRGAFVSISAEDVGRTELGFLAEYTGAIGGAGADRIRLSDTIGILTPEEYAARVACVRSSTSVDLQCHCHNDFGLAVANTLAGLQAGARYFHVCVNGIGERAGMPDFAQMCMALKLLYDRDVGIQTQGLKELSKTVAEATRQPITPWQPIVGENVFAHESGIHVKGMLKDARTFEPFGPEEVGGSRRFVVGKHSGRALVKYLLTERGVAVDEQLLAQCLTMLRSESIRSGGAIEPDRVVLIYRRLAEKGAVAA